MTPPVLFLIFNRPELTRTTFERIRAARPSRLFIHADGPRPDRPDEASLCAATRAVTDAIDWPCETRRLFREENLGCGPAVHSALAWFFEQVEEGIVIEDDCAPLPEFFLYCEHTLDRHRADPAVMHVSGMGFRFPGAPADCAAFLSPLPFIWGWATWRRAWQRYQFTLPAATEVETVLARECPTREMRAYWREKFDATRSGAIRTWDYQWVYALWSHGASGVTPTVSLVENLGFGAESTHTRDSAVGYAPLLAGPLPSVLPLATPSRGETMIALHQAIFAPTRPAPRLDDFLRKPAWLWRVYLGLRRRFGIRS